MLMSLLRFSIVHHNEKSYVTVSRDKERDMTVMRIVTSHLVITAYREFGWCGKSNNWSGTLSPPILFHIRTDDGR